MKMYHKLSEMAIYLCRLGTTWVQTWVKWFYPNRVGSLPLSLKMWVMLCDEVYRVVTFYELYRNQGRTGTSALIETSKICGLSSKRVRTYVRFSYLTADILNAIEAKVIRKSVAYELSYFSEETQNEFYMKLVSGEKITAEMLRHFRLSEL